MRDYSAKSESYGNLHISDLNTLLGGWLVLMLWQLLRPSTISFQWWRDLHERQHFPHHLLNAVNSSRCSYIVSLPHTTYMYFGLEIHDHPNLLLHRCCAQFQCIDNSLLHQKHMVFGQELYKQPNLAPPILLTSS